MNSKGCLFPKGRVKPVPILGDYVSVLVHGSHTNQPNLGDELYTDTFKLLSSTCLSSKSLFFFFLHLGISYLQFTDGQAHLKID